MFKRLFYWFRFYFTRLFYTIGAIIIGLFILAFFFPFLLQIATIAFLCLCITVLLDFIIVFAGNKPVTAKRLCAERFSNGDENKIIIQLNNHRAYKVRIQVIDELPIQFEQIKEYVQGDDYRRLNWKATARKNSLMVNNYMDERSQQVVCLIDKGRSMKMPFEGMTLLDYAINATLVLSNIVLLKQDKSGL